MTAMHPVLIDVPLPIRTPRLLLRGKQPGDGALTAAVAETWEDLHRWMDWAENLEDNTAEKQEIRTRQVMAKLLLREEFNLVGIELATGQPVIWCGFHSVDWRARGCDTGYWVRKSAQGRGFATESTNALLRFAFGPLGMQRVGLSHTEGNVRSRRVAEKLGFLPEGFQRSISLVPGGRVTDKRLYARFDTLGLPDLEVHWGPDALPTEGSAAELSAHLRTLEEQLLKQNVRAEPAAVSPLLTEDFREFGSSGRSYTKTDILQTLASDPPASLHLTDFACELVSPGTALVTYRSHRTDDTGTTISALRSSLWVNRGSGWKLHFHQGTRQPPPTQTANN